MTTMMDNAISSVVAFKSLERIHQHLNDAEKELEIAIATPLCVESCGVCCEHTTPHVWEVEARYIISYLLGDGGTGRLSNISEGWLLDRPNGIALYGRQEKITKEIWPTLRSDINATMSGPCPLLDAKRCTIYGCRPIACRAWGITKFPTKECKRHLGISESESRRAYYGGTGAQRLEQEIQAFLLSLPGNYRRSWFLPTVLLALVSPDRFNLIVGQNKIASAKLATSVISPNIIWQHQLEALWKRGTQ